MYSRHRIGRVLSFFSSRRNWDSPNPSTAGECTPPPHGSGGRGTLAGERGYGRVPIPTRGKHCGTLYIYVLCYSRCTWAHSWPARGPSTILGKHSPCKNFRQRIFVIMNLRSVFLHKQNIINHCAIHHVFGSTEELKMLQTVPLLISQ